MLRTSNRGVADAFAQRRAAINSNGQMFSPDGVTLYSYGAHWPIAAWIKGECVFHSERCSVTTSKQTSFARGAAAIAGVPVRTVPTRRDLLAEQGKAFL